MARLALAALAVVAIGWLVAAAVLMNVVGIVHAWWPFVPTMPYSVALKIAAVRVVAQVIVNLVKGAFGGDS